MSQEDELSKRSIDAALDTKPTAGPKPREWWAVLNIHRNEGTIAAKDRAVQYEHNVEHVHVIEYSALAEANKRIAELEQDKKEMQHEWDLCVSRDTNSHSDWLEIYGELTEAKARIAELERAVAEAHNDVRIQIGKRTLVEIDFTAANERIVELEAEVEELMKVGYWQDQCCTELRNELTAAEQRVKELEAEIEAFMIGRG